MKKLFFVMVAVCALAGCRRGDVREFTVGIEDLSEQKKALVVEALAKYNGIRKDSYRWDFEKKTLTLSYDSMQIAKENIRQAIESKKLVIKRP